MLYLSRRTVRHGWPLYAGAFVALATGVLLLGLAGTTIAATAAYTADHPSGLLVTVTGAGEAPHQVRYAGDDVAGLASVLGIIATISSFITMFVVASTFAFVVASRRRELGLLRLVGATPRQVRRMVRGEAFCVAVLAALAGSAVALLLTPVVLAKASGTELAPVRLEQGNSWLALAITSVAGITMAMLGARSASKRAAKVTPVEALREATIEPRRIGVVRAVAGILCAAGAIAMLVFIRPESGEAVIPLAMFAPQLLVVALVALAPIVMPPIVRLWSTPLVRLTRISGRLAGSNVAASPRRTASLAAPILAISAIAGSMVATLSFAADGSAAHLRHDVTAPLVVTGDGRDLGDTLAKTPGVTAVHGALPLEVIRTDKGDATGESSAGIDPVAFAATHRLDVRKGSLDDLRGDTVALNRETASLEGYRVGDTMSVAFLDGRTAKLRVVAVLGNSPDVVPAMMLPMELARAHAPDAVPAEWFVQAASLPEIPGATVTPVADWLAQRDDQLRDGNKLGLLILIGPAGLYAAIAIANTLLMGSLSRRHEFVTARLLGATPAQVRRMVLWESTVVGCVALTLGTAITATVGLLIHHAMTAGLDAGRTVPWLMFGAIGVTCLLVAVGAALAPTAYVLRNARPADAVGD